jgi:2-methylcitrate dehydratase
VKTGLRGKFAINYVVALSVLEGKLDNDTFTDAKASDPLVQQALGKVHVIIDDSIPEPGTYCPVTIELKNGSRLSHTARIAKGHPENPMTESEVLAKFRNNASGIISAERSEQLIAALRNLEDIGDLRDLAGFLRPA